MEDGKVNPWLAAEDIAVGVVRTVGVKGIVSFLKNVFRGASNQSVPRAEDVYLALVDLEKTLEVGVRVDVEKLLKGGGG